MRIKASVGRAPKTVGLKDQCCSLQLTAQNTGEKQFLAGLLESLGQIGPYQCALRERPPEIKIIVAK